MLRLLRGKGAGGFSLVETLAAVLIFGMMTLGLVPLVISSVRGSNKARTLTVTKNVVLQSMERVRGLPYHKQVQDSSGNPKAVDVLDLYFPNTGTGYSSTTKIFTTTCTPATSSPQCPAGVMPSSVGSLVYEARFVGACDPAITSSCSPAAAGTAEEFRTVTPPATYDWRGAAQTCSGSPCSDRPPADLMELTITATYVTASGNRTYSQKTLLSDRRFGGPKIDGAANIDYVVRVIAGYNVAGQQSDLTATVGQARSSIESRLTTASSFSGQSIRLLLTDATAPLTADVDVSGGTGSVQAPPETVGTTVTTNPGPQVSHADLGNQVVAGGDRSSVSSYEAHVGVDLPVAFGSLAMSPANNSLPGMMWVTSQTDTVNNPLQLNTGTGAMVWMRPFSGVNVAASTRGEATDVDNPGSRMARTTASGSFGSLRFLPVSFISDNSAEGAVVELQSFTSQVTCTSTAQPAASNPDPVATWSATLRYWVDNDSGGSGPGSGTNVGHYESVALGGAAGVTALANLKANPPLVYEAPDPIDPLTGNPVPYPSKNDVYLFPVTHIHTTIRDVEDSDADGDTNEVIDVTHNHAGYLTDWAAQGAGQTNESADGRRTSARLAQMFRLTTSPTNPSLIASVLNVTVGSMDCEAQDLR